MYVLVVSSVEVGVLVFSSLLYNFGSKHFLLSLLNIDLTSDQRTKDNVHRHTQPQRSEIFFTFCRHINTKSINQPESRHQVRRAVFQAVKQEVGNKDDAAIHPQGQNVYRDVQTEEGTTGRKGKVSEGQQNSMRPENVLSCGVGEKTTVTLCCVVPGRTSCRSYC